MSECYSNGVSQQYCHSLFWNRSLFQLGDGFRLMMAQLQGETLVQKLHDLKRFEFTVTKNRRQNKILRLDSAVGNVNPCHDWLDWLKLKRNQYVFVMAIPTDLASKDEQSIWTITIVNFMNKEHWKLCPISRRDTQYSISNVSGVSKIYHTERWLQLPPQRFRRPPSKPHRNGQPWIPIPSLQSTPVIW